MTDDTIRDLTDDECRAGLVLKWGELPLPGYGPDVLPAWVAEMDFALAPVVTQALTDAVGRGTTGYPPRGDLGVGAALAGFARRRWDWAIDPDRVVLTGDVMAGIRVAFEALCEPAPVVVPVPTYYPFLDVVPLSGRERWDLPLDPDAGEATIDLDALDALFVRGARTLLLCQPHNPWGRVFTREELEGIRDVCVRHGVTVVSDEIHAPLTFDRRRHLSYLAVDGTADHAVAVTAGSKAFNVAGLKCAQIVCGNDEQVRRIRALPHLLNNATSTLGAVATRAAYEGGDAWLDALVVRLQANRDHFRARLSEQLPDTRMRSLEATYLAFVDARAYGFDNPSARALEAGRVYVNDGASFGTGGEGWVRVNLATSTARLDEVVRRLRTAWEARR